MGSPRQNPLMIPQDGAIVMSEANSGLPLRGDFERMARRRFQNPKPFREGAWWWIFVRRDVFSQGKVSRRKERVKLAPATMSDREVRKVSAEYLRPLNQGLEISRISDQLHHLREQHLHSGGAAIDGYDRRKSRSRGVIQNYLQPAFGTLALRDLDTCNCIGTLPACPGTHVVAGIKDKIRDVLSVCLGRAVRHQLLMRNPMEGLQLPPGRAAR